MEDKTDNELEIMKREIDTLQIEIMKINRPWYKSPSVLIAILALIFSFGATTVSFQREAREDIRLARAELRGILQRIMALPKDNFEITKKYKNDPEGQSLSGFIGQENSLLARQASEIVDRFPDEVSAGEYLSVAFALVMAADMEKIPRYLDRALTKTSDPGTKSRILWMYGAHLIQTGKTSDGRRRYEQALNIWRDYPNVADYFKKWTDGFTEMYWAQAEIGVHNIEEAKTHIRKALQHASVLPDSPATSQLRDQILHTQKSITRLR